jgi:murein L,D-transpeptidase YcbB/YkuD
MRWVRQAVPQGSGCQATETDRRSHLATSIGLFLTLGLVPASHAQARPADLPAAQGDVSATRIDLDSASPALRRLYGEGRAPIWSDDAASSLESSLRHATRHGLDPAPYLALLSQHSALADQDMLRSCVALAYAKALASGVIDPHAVFQIYTLPDDTIDLATGLRAALRVGGVSAWLEALAPQSDEYRALSTAYVTLLSRVGSSQAPPIAGGRSIHIDDIDPRASQVRAAIEREVAAAVPGDVPTAPVKVSVWTAADADLLRAYQRSRGLAADGVVGSNSLAMLNATPRDKARRLAVNLERMRWLEHSPPPTRIDVNTAASTLTYFLDGRAVWSTAVVTGRPGHATPQLQASFQRLVLNPPWYVPTSIARREIDPKGPAYLRRHHMRRVAGRIIQSAGPWAALGQVKFDMQNRYAIYLHDTPAKGVFARSQRHLSHGCVRVEDALAFARRLAEASGAGADYDQILESGRTGTVKLNGSIPVRLIYKTALVGPDGAVTFRPDVYGWDRRTAAAMGMTKTAREGVEPIASAPLGP